MRQFLINNILHELLRCLSALILLSLHLTNLTVILPIEEILRSSLLVVEGKLQCEGEVTHVVVRRCYDMSGLLREMNVLEALTSRCKRIHATMKKMNPFPIPETKKCGRKKSSKWKFLLQGGPFYHVSAGV
jgi:hypothetical protein